MREWHAVPPPVDFVQVALVDPGATVAAELPHPQRLQVAGVHDETRLLGELADGRVDEVLAGLEVAAGVAPATGLVQRVVAALLHQQPPVRVDHGDGGEPVHRATLATAHIRTR